MVMKEEEKFLAQFGSFASMCVVVNIWFWDACVLV